MNYQEFYENGTESINLKTDFIDNETYEKIHEKTVILCHDVFIKYKERGILLVKRLKHPAKDIHWPVGGRILRGNSTEESLKKKSLDECGFILTNINYLGVARTFFKDSPFSHNRGTDTLNLIFIAEGNGELILNSIHSEPIFVTRNNYDEIRSSLDSYVQTYLDIINERSLW